MHRQVALVALVASAVNPRARAQEGCPVDPAAGYPVTVSADAGTELDPAFLHQFAVAAAHRWRVPSRSRDTYRGWGSLRNRLLPPEPRWADDWKPEAKHQATLRVTLYHDGRAHSADPDPSSGDKRFDRSLETIFDKPMPGAPEWPALPASIQDDSVVVQLSLGMEGIVQPHGTVRFAAHQMPARLIPGTLVLEITRDRSSVRPRVRPVTVKYDVTAKGEIEAIQILVSSGPHLDRPIVEGLQRARFEPATSNCRPIAQTVVQIFPER